MSPIVFIVGAQRSGTTWLQRLLASHPRIAGGQESHLFSGYLEPMWQRWQSEHAYRTAGGRTIGLGCYLDEKDFLEELRGLACRALGRVLQAKPGAALIVEKTPDHGLHLPLIHRLFPDAAVLHIQRDGRDVVASLLQVQHTSWGRSWSASSAVAAAQRWTSWVRAIQKDLPLFARARTLRYEELSAQTVETVAGLFEFLEHPLPRGEVQDICRRWSFQECQARTGADSLILHESLRGGLLEPDGFHRAGRVGDWRDSLSVEDQVVVAEQAGSLLGELGYTDVPPPPASESAAEPNPWFVSLAPREDLLWKQPRSLSVIDTTNAQMLHRERLLLYATVLALAPERCLEVGVCEGGSSRIIHAALNDLGRGQLVSIDPQPHFTPELEQALADRVTFLPLPSPQGLEEAREKAGGLFDFVLLDGDHAEQGVRNDLIGLVEVLRPGAIILAHDAYYTPVAAGIRSVLHEDLPLTDVGIISTTRHPGKQGKEKVSYGGFRMLVRTADEDRRPPQGLIRRLTRKLSALLGG